jgi:hypothetical protein
MEGKMVTRTIKLTWEEFENLLKKTNENILDDERISNLTLVKPKAILIQLERRVERVE